MRSGMVPGVLALLLASSGVAGATEAQCRAGGGAKAAALYLSTAKLFNACAKRTAAGTPCDQATRDAKIATKLARTRATLQVVCDGATATALGFASNGALAVRVAGTAAGEGRQAADAVFGRDPGLLSPSEKACASVLTTQAGKAGKKLVKTLVPCGAACGPAEQGIVDGAYANATTAINRRCTPTIVMALTGSDLATHLALMRAGAMRVVAAFAPGSNPVVSVVTPTPGTILVPPSLPASVDVAARVLGVPHVGYVNSVEVAGQGTTYDAVANLFEHTLLVPLPPATLPVFVRARTTLGTFSTTASVRFNLGTLAPSVAITSPASGTITPAGSITVSGQVLGNLAEADVLTVDGALTSFNPTTGAFSRSVTLGAGSVHIIEAAVQSLSLGTTNEDSVVILKGTALPLTSRVPNANFNRLNNSGFHDVEGVVQTMLEPAFAPANFIGQSAGGGTVTAFSTGAKDATVFGAGLNTVTAEISINSFHIGVSGLTFGCSAVYNASNVLITANVNLIGQLQVSINSSDVIFTGGSASLTGGILCDFVDLFLSDLEGDMEGQLKTKFQEKLPDAFNGALAGINISGPIGAALDVNIDAVYSDIPEDSQGVTFVVDSNVIALDPIPDAPPITQTLVPTSSGPPVLGPNVPGTGTPYDLAFCLSDGFVNRAMAAFMLQGRFNQSLTEVPVGGTTLALTTGILSALLGDPTYSTACPGCSVTLVLKPTSAAVARAPIPGETASVVLVVPNYRVDAIADASGSPLPLISANVTFDLPITLNVAGSTITPTVGTLTVSNVKVTDNPLDANPAAFAAQVSTLFPLAGQSLGALFGEIPLPTFQGLAVTGVASGYNVSCTAIYLNLS